MTKQELLNALKTLPDEAEIVICSSDVLEEFPIEVVYLMMGGEKPVPSRAMLAAPLPQEKRK